MFEHYKEFKTNRLKIEVFADSKAILDIIEEHLCDLQTQQQDQITITFYLATKKENAFTEENGFPFEQSFIDFKQKKVYGNYLELPFLLDADMIIQRPLGSILSSMGYERIHGALVTNERASIIFSGPSMSGKSTLSTLMSTQGFHLQCDDMIFIKETQNGFDIIPFMSSIRIRNQEDKNIKNPTMSQKTSTHKQLIFIFPTYKQEHNPLLTKLSSPQILNNIINDNVAKNMGVPDNRQAQEQFFDFACKLSQKNGYALQYNDQNLPGAVELIQNIFSRNT